jgi:PhnB protein
MNMNTYVNFSGKCAEAFRYYEKHLGAKVGMVMTHAQSPSPSRVSPEWKDAVLHRIYSSEVEHGRDDRTP